MRRALAGLTIVALMMAPTLGQAKKKVKDRKAPTVAFTAPWLRLPPGGGSAPAPLDTQPIVFHVPQLSSGRIFGKAADSLSGVKSVTVTWTRCAEPPQADAAACTPIPNGTGVGAADNILFTPSAVTGCAPKAKSCNWTQQVPQFPGVFKISAVARDMAGNASSAKVAKIVVA